MRRAKPIGYAWDVDYWCPRCWKKTGHSLDMENEHEDGVPVWNDEAFDEPPHCCYCSNFLGGYLTSQGVDNLLAAIHDGRVSIENHCIYIDHYYIGGSSQWCVFEHFYGKFDLDGHFYGYDDYY